MRFKTASGTEYILKGVETQITATGEECPSVGPQGIPVVMTFTGNLARVGTPLRDIYSGEYIENTNEFYSVEFSKKPAIGESFTYYHELWAGCYSTPVSEIGEDDE